MRTNSTTLAPGCTLVKENSKHGPNGWATEIVCSRNPTGDKWEFLARDTAGASIKNVTADPVEWTEIIRPDNTPAGTVGVGGERPGCYAFDWAGQSSSVGFAVMQSKVMRLSNGVFVDLAPIPGGMDTRPGYGDGRMLNKKCASDPLNGNVLYVMAGSKGLRLTLNALAANPADVFWQAPATAPAPTAPFPGSTDADQISGRWGQVAIDTTSARIDVGTSTERYSRVVHSSAGQGIRESTDGGLNWTNISPSGVTITSDIHFRSGVLLIVAAAANPAGNVANNVWTRTGSTWTNLNTNGDPIFSACPDPRNAAHWIMVHVSGAWSHVKDLATPAQWTRYEGGNSEAYQLGQVRVRARPLTARLFRNKAGSSAPGPMHVCGDWLYYLTGYGPLRFPIATFPQPGASFANKNYDPAWPDWQEDGAGYEAVVGMFTFWGSKGLWQGGQDLGMTLDPIGSGHEATYRDWPGPPLLTNSISGSAGVDLDFCVAGHAKNGENFGYTTNGEDFIKCVNQPPVANQTASGPSGAVVAGIDAADGTILWFDSFSGIPLWTDDLGATAWKPLTFRRIDGSLIDLSTFPGGKTGFHGAPFYSSHVCCAHDKDNPGTYYAVNIGASVPGGSEGSWDTSGVNADTTGMAGLYKMTPAEPGVFRQVLQRKLHQWGNNSQLDMQLEFSGDGHLLVRPTFQLNTSSSDQATIDVNLSDYTTRPITAVQNCRTISVGAPLVAGGPRACWFLGWRGNQFRKWLSFDRFQTAPVADFDPIMPGGSGIKHMSAHPTRFGEFGYALAAGHGRGRVVQMA